MDRDISVINHVSKELAYVKYLRMNIPFWEIFCLKITFYAHIAKLGQNSDNFARFGDPCVIANMTICGYILQGSIIVFKLLTIHNRL